MSNPGGVEVEKRVKENHVIRQNREDSEMRSREQQRAEKMLQPQLGASNLDSFEPRASKRSRIDKIPVASPVRFQFVYID
jgi:hypothetical protein